MIENIDKRYLAGGVAVIIIGAIIWYYMSKSDSKIDGYKVPPHPQTLDELKVNSKYKKPILGGVDNFISEADCSDIIKIGQQIVEPSSLGSGADNTIDETMRSSQHSWLKHDAHPALLKIANYVSVLTATPLDNFEPFQIVNYGPNQFYKYHMDSCNPDAPDYSECLKNQAADGARKYTVLLYLNNNYIGGETHFSELDTVVKRPPGSLVVFQNLKDGGRETDPNSLHAGTPVIAGAKWIINLWIRDRKVNKASLQSAWPNQQMMDAIQQRESERQQAYHKQLALDEAQKGAQNDGASKDGAPKGGTPEGVGADWQSNSKEKGIGDKNVPANHIDIEDILPSRPPPKTVGK